mgnify:CR=1 FL=1|tara:strand:- start:15522 stop:16043 length:522 start_codon:yes stop_codon:yes gene_type:complete
MKLKFNSKIGFLSKLKTHYITLTKSQLEQTFSANEKGSIYNQRYTIHINNKVNWKGGSLALGNNQAYIALSKERMKKSNCAFNDTVEVTLERDHSLYGFDVPEEFEELLRQDDHARICFESLTMGKRRAVIYLVLQIKSSDKRIEKSIFLLDNIKRASVGNITMRHILGKDLD